jgi:hypothetical protein
LREVAQLDLPLTPSQMGKTPVEILEVVIQSLAINQDVVKEHQDAFAEQWL